MYHGKSDIKVTYSDCTVSKNWEFQMVSPGKLKWEVKSTGRFLEPKYATGFDLPSTAKYFCQEQSRCKT